MISRVLLLLALAISISLNIHLLQRSPDTAPNLLQTAARPEMAPSSIPEVPLPEPAALQPATTLQEPTIAQADPVSLEPEIPEPEPEPDPISFSIVVGESGGVQWKQLDADTAEFQFGVDRELSPDLIGARLRAVSESGATLPIQLKVSAPTTWIVGTIQHPWDSEQITLEVDSGNRVQRFETSLERELRFTHASAREQGSSIQIQIDSNAGVTGNVSDYVDTIPALRTSAYTNYRGDIILNGPFEPRTVYQIILKKGLMGRDGFRSKSDQVLAVKTPSYGPLFQFAAQGPYFPKSRDTLIPIKTRNVERGTITATRIYPNNVLDFHRDGLHSSSRNGRQSEPMEITPETPKDATEVVFVDLDPVLDGLEFGFYRIDARAPRASSWNAGSRALLLTDIGLEATLDPKTAHCWARSLTDGAPMSNVRFELRSQQNQLLATDRSNEHGYARLPFDGQSGEPYMLIARRAKDLSYLELGYSTKENLTPFEFPNSRPTDRVYDAYVYTDRGIYRPGESIDLFSLVRENQTAADQLASVIELRDPEGELFLEKTLESNQYGFLSERVEIPESAKTGVYSIQLRQPGNRDNVWGSTSVRVDFFTPNRLRVTTTPSQESAALGDSVQLSTQADYYFGLPGSALLAQSRVQYRPQPFEPRSYSEFVFGDSERSFNRQSIEEFESKTDAQGELNFDLQIPQGLVAPAGIEAVVSTSISEPSGSTVTSNTSIDVHPVPAYIGLRRLDDTSRAGQPVWDFEWTRLTPNAEPSPTDAALNYRLERDDWNYVMTEDADGNRIWDWRKNTVVESRGTVTESSNSANGRFTLPIPDVYGYYRIVISSATDSAQTALRFAAGRGEGSPAMAQLEGLRLTPNQTSYLPGQEVALSFDAPTQGQVLVVVSDHTDATAYFFNANAGENTIRFPAPTSAFGSAYAGVTLVKTDFSDRRIPRRQFGMARLTLDQSERRIDIQIKVPDNANPGDQIDIAALVDPTDNFQPFQLQLIGVDEGALALTAFESPDPYAHFYGPRGPTVSIHHMYNALFPEIESAEGGSSQIGGDTGRSLFVNPEQAKQERTARFVSPVIDIDSPGNTVIPVQLPDHVGELRVMAVAFNQDQVGAASKPLTLKDTISLTLDGPRAVAPSDIFTLTASVFNQSAPGSHATLEIESLNGLEVLESSAQTEDVPTGSRWSPQFRINTAGVEPGILRFRALLTLSGETRESTVEVSLRPGSARESAVTLIEVPAGETRNIAIPGDWISGTERIQVEMGVSPFIELGVEQWLNAYPYGCLEQTVSGAFPALFLQSIIPEFSQNEAVGKTKVNNAIQRVRALSRPEGGFAMWPRAQSRWLQGSLYAAHFLAEAHTQGHELATQTVPRLIEFLRDTAIHGANGASGPEERAYALFVLSILNAPELELAKALAGATGSTRLTKILLAGALARGGDTRSAMERFDDAMAITSDKDGDSIWNDPIRELAFALAIGSELQPNADRTLQLGTQLRNLRNRKGHWGNTQNNAMVAYAFGSFAKHRPLSSDATGEYTIADAPTRTLSAENPGAISGLSANDGPIRVTSHGPGPIYVSIYASGVPKTGPDTPQSISRGLALRRTYRDLQGNPIDSVQQGDLITVEIQLDSQSYVENVVIADLAPGFLQIEDSALATSAAVANALEDIQINHYEKRDDRLLLFTDVHPRRSFRFTYTGRVVTPGTYQIPGITAEGMYRPEMFASINPANTIVAQ